MKNKIIEQRLSNYPLQSKQDEENALKEIIQEIALFSLSRKNFFKEAAFMGGTALRILYGLPRFSEDLDFSALSSSMNFQWSPFLKEVVGELSDYGLEISVIDRSQTSSAIKKAFIKDNSFGKQLNLKYPRSKSDQPLAKIRFEIDTNPPLNGLLESKVVTFPLPFSIVCFDLPTLFAGKINALLTRSFTKGRDWFDFIWYKSQNIEPNLAYLQSALQQFNQTNSITVDSASQLKQILTEKIKTISWQEAKEDVAFLLRPEDRFSLEQWNKDFFLSLL